MEVRHQWVIMQYVHLGLMGYCSCSGSTSFFLIGDIIAACLLITTTCLALVLQLYRFALYSSLRFLNRQWRNQLAGVLSLVTHRHPSYQLPTFGRPCARICSVGLQRAVVLQYDLFDIVEYENTCLTLTAGHHTTDLLCIPIKPQ